MKEPSSQAQSFGLDEKWPEVEKILEEIVPIYDRTNRFISLGTDLRIRRDGISLLNSIIAKQSFALLDLGSGTGRMSQIMRESATRLHQTLNTVMVDPLAAMMRLGKKRNSPAEGLLAVYENLPFDGSRFDAAMAGFAIRDARNLGKALGEISRILVPGGKFLIVDLCKSDSKVKRMLVGFYWKIIAPSIAFFSSGRRGLKFAALSTTYEKLPSNSEFVTLVEISGFKVEAKKFFMLQGAWILILTKKIV